MAVYDYEEKGYPVVACVSFAVVVILLLLKFRSEISFREPKLGGFALSLISLWLLIASFFFIFSVGKTRAFSVLLFFLAMNGLLGCYTGNEFALRTFVVLGALSFFILNGTAAQFVGVATPLYVQTRDSNLGCAGSDSQFCTWLDEGYVDFSRFLAQITLYSLGAALYFAAEAVGVPFVK